MTSPTRRSDELPLKAAQLPDEPEARDLLAHYSTCTSFKQSDLGCDMRPPGGAFALWSCDPSRSNSGIMGPAGNDAAEVTRTPGNSAPQRSRQPDLRVQAGDQGTEPTQESLTLGASVSPKTSDSPTLLEHQRPRCDTPPRDVLKPDVGAMDFPLPNPFPYASASAAQQESLCGTKKALDTSAVHVDETGHVDAPSIWSSTRSDDLWSSAASVSQSSRHDAQAMERDSTRDSRVPPEIGVSGSNSADAVKPCTTIETDEKLEVASEPDPLTCWVQQLVEDARIESIAEREDSAKRQSCSIANAERMGQACTHMMLVHSNIPLYGRCDVTFRRARIANQAQDDASASFSLTSCKFKVGDCLGVIVEQWNSPEFIISELETPKIAGFVICCTPSSITLSANAESVQELMPILGVQQVTLYNVPKTPSFDTDCRFFTHLIMRPHDRETRRSRRIQNIAKCGLGIRIPAFDQRPLTKLLKALAPTDTDLDASKGLEADPCMPWNHQIAADLEALAHLKHLNLSQREAIALALRARDVACIHGPPGTGKTTTLVECVRLFAQKGYRILITAATHSAVDNALNSCVSRGIRGCLRLGHFTKVHPSLQQCTLNAMAKKVPSFNQYVSACLTLDQKLAEVIQPVTSNAHNRQTQIRLKEQLRSQMKGLYKHCTKLQYTTYSEVFTQSTVIFTTCASASASQVNSYLKAVGALHFDVILIDEATQVNEIHRTSLSLNELNKEGSLGSILLLFGDHKQLPPFTRNHAQRNTTTLFERVIENLGTKVSHMLTVQYRMHQDIMRWPSATFYNSQLVAAPVVAQRDLQDLLGPRIDLPSDTTSVHPLLLLLTQNPIKPLLWFDTAGVSNAAESGGRNRDAFASNPLFDQSSKYNSFEALCVVRYLGVLAKILNGALHDLLAIITPYSAQQCFIKNALIQEEERTKHDLASIPVASVDSFQGREYPIVIISLVRSNEHEDIGFLQDYRRLNVATTRAQRHLVIVGDSSMVRGHQPLETLLKTFRQHGEVLPATMLVSSHLPPDDCASQQHRSFSSIAQFCAQSLETTKKKIHPQAAAASPSLPSSKLVEIWASMTKKNKSNEKRLLEMYAEHCRLTLPHLVQKKTVYHSLSNLPSSYCSVLHSVAESLKLNHVTEVLHQHNEINNRRCVKVWSDSATPNHNLKTLSMKRSVFSE